MTFSTYFQRIPAPTHRLTCFNRAGPQQGRAAQPPQGTPCGPPRLPHSPRQQSRPPPAPQEGYEEPGQDGGQLPAAQLPVPASQLPQEQLEIGLGHCTRSAPLSGGGGKTQLSAALPAASAVAGPLRTYSTPPFSQRVRMRIWKRKRNHVCQAEGDCALQPAVGIGSGRRGKRVLKTRLEAFLYLKKERENQDARYEFVSVNVLAMLVLFAGIICLIHWRSSGFAARQALIPTAKSARKHPLKEQYISAAFR